MDFIYYEKCICHTTLTQSWHFWGKFLETFFKWLMGLLSTTSNHRTVGTPSSKNLWGLMAKEMLLVDYIILLQKPTTLSSKKQQQEEFSVDSWLEKCSLTRASPLWWWQGSRNVCLNSSYVIFTIFTGYGTSSPKVGRSPVVTMLTPIIMSVIK